MEKGAFFEKSPVHIIPELRCQKKCANLNFVSLLCTQPAHGWVSSFLRKLIGRATVAQHIRIPNRITVLAHGIAGVALYGIDTAILDFFHNTHMVG